MPEFRRGRRVAIDWGKARIGVAACDPDGIVSHPVETVANNPGALDRIAAIVADYEPIEVLLGMPINLRGERGPAAKFMESVAGALADRLDVALRIVDERMSTGVAARKLQAAGKSSRSRRGIIDQAAAVDILDMALERERVTGTPAGELWRKEDA